MEYLILNEHPHIERRYKQLRDAKRIDGTWCALFKTHGYKRMKLHAARCGVNFTFLVGKALNLPDERELFTIVRTTSLGWIVLARGKVDAEQ